MYPKGSIERAWAERKRRFISKDVVKEAKYIWDESAEEAEGPRNDILLHGLVPFRFITGARDLCSAVGTPWENRLIVESLYRMSK